MARIHFLLLAATILVLSLAVTIWWWSHVFFSIQSAEKTNCTVRKIEPVTCLSGNGSENCYDVLLSGVVCARNQSLSYTLVSNDSGWQLEQSVPCWRLEELCRLLINFDSIYDSFTPGMLILSFCLLGVMTVVTLSSCPLCQRRERL